MIVFFGEVLSICKINTSNYYKENSFVETTFGLSTYIGLLVTENDIFLNEEVKNKLSSLLEQLRKLLLDQKKKKVTTQQQDSYRDEVFSFCKKFGYEIEVGTYYYGGVFVHNRIFQFSEHQDDQSKKNAKASASHASFQVSVNAGLGSGSANGSFGQSKKSNTSSLKSQSGKTYYYRESILATPWFEDVFQWRNALAANQKYWKLIKADTKLVPLASIFANKNNSITEPSKEMHEVIKMFIEICDQFNVIAVHEKEDDEERQNQQKFIKDRCKEKVPYKLMFSRSPQQGFVQINFTNSVPHTDFEVNVRGSHSIEVVEKILIPAGCKGPIRIGTINERAAFQVVQMGKNQRVLAHAFLELQFGQDQSFQIKESGVYINSYRVNDDPHQRKQFLLG